MISQIFLLIYKSDLIFSPTDNVTRLNKQGPRPLRFFSTIILIYIVFLKTLLAPLPASAAAHSPMSELCLSQGSSLAAPIEPETPFSDISCCDEACLTKCLDQFAPINSGFEFAYGLLPPGAGLTLQRDWLNLQLVFWRLTKGPGAPRAPPASQI